jgi:hypothetical protein
VVVGGGGEQLNDVWRTVWSVLLCEPCDPSSLQLLDIFGGAVHPVTDRDREGGQSSVVLLVLTDPCLQLLDAYLITTPLLCVIDVPLLECDSEATGDGSEGGCVDVVMRFHERKSGLW